MRIERLRIVLPARLRHTAPEAARAIAEQIAFGLTGVEAPPARLSIRLDGQGRPAPLLATAVGRAAPGAAATPLSASASASASASKGGKPWR